MKTSAIIRGALPACLLGLALAGSTQMASACPLNNTGLTAGGAAHDFTTSTDGRPYRPTSYIIRTAAEPCPSDLVWRERFDGDTVCVTPLERDANRRRRSLP